MLNTRLWGFSLQLVLMNFAVANLLPQQKFRKKLMNVTNPKREQSPSRAKQTLELISFLTHELKTPLTSIITSAGLLVEELALSPDDSKTKLIGNILTSAYNLEARTSELLELAKLEAEGFQLELEPTDINTIVYNAVDQLSPIIYSKNQSLSLNIAISSLVSLL